MRPFQDRIEAGWLLAHRVAALALEDPVVVGLPRGGIPVAAEVAEALGAPLDLIVVRKLAVPHCPDYAFGAVGECGTLLIDPDIVDRSGMSPSTVADVTAAESEEVLRQVTCYRAAVSPVEVRGRTVVIVDDGLVTGATARAAMEIARARGAGRVVLAVPVATPESVRALRQVANAVVTLVTQPARAPVADAYDEFLDVEDAEILRTLCLATKRMRAEAPVREHIDEEPGGRPDPQLAPAELTA